MSIEQIIMILAALLPSLVIGAAGFRQSVRLDKGAAESEVEASELRSTAQIISGLTALVVRLQKEIDRLQALLERLQKELTVSRADTKRGRAGN